MDRRTFLATALIAAAGARVAASGLARDQAISLQPHLGADWGSDQLKASDLRRIPPNRKNHRIRRRLYPSLAVQHFDSTRRNAGWEPGGINFDIVFQSLHEIDYARYFHRAFQNLTGQHPDRSRDQELRFSETLRRRGEGLSAP